MKYVVRKESYDEHSPTWSEDHELETYGDAKEYYDTCSLDEGIETNGSGWDSVELLTIHESKHREQ